MERVGRAGALVCLTARSNQRRSDPPPGRRTFNEKMPLIAVTLRSRTMIVRSRTMTVRSRTMTVRSRTMTVRSRTMTVRSRTMIVRSRTMTVRSRTMTVRSRTMTVRSRTMTVRSRTMTVRSRTAGLPATCEVAPLTGVHRRLTQPPCVSADQIGMAPYQRQKNRRGTLTLLLPHSSVRSVKNRTWSSRLLSV